MWFQPPSLLIEQVWVPGMQYCACRIHCIVYTASHTLSHNLVKVIEWCELKGMKLNASKTQTLIVSRSRTMHPQSPALTIGRTMLKESMMTLLYWEWQLIPRWFLRSIFARFEKKRLGIVRISWQAFHYRLRLGRCFRGFVLPVLEYCSAVWCSAPIHTLN